MQLESCSQALGFSYVVDTMQKISTSSKLSDDHPPVCLMLLPLCHTESAECLLGNLESFKSFSDALRQLHCSKKG